MAPMLDEFSFADPRLTLVPIEHLGPDGVTPDFAATLRTRAGWSDERIDLLDESFQLYWHRLAGLSRRSRDLSPPRLRNIGVVTDPGAVRPYASILNTSTWTLYDCDLDPERSDPELVAYLLAHGDRMAEIGEVTLAAVHLAPWWFERDADERDAFVAAARASNRPDAATYRAIADALPWLRELRHAKMRPPRAASAHRAVPGTGLLVPRAIEHEPERLVERCRAAASATLEAFHARWRTGEDATATDELLAWLAEDAPPLLISGRRGALLWDPARAQDVAAVRTELGPAGTAALREVAADLRAVALHTRRFLAALREPDSLPEPDPHAAQSGYAFMHASRRLVAYNLHEPGIERLLGPALPYARDMLAARTIHEWAHLAVDGGFVPRTIDDASWGEVVGRFATLLDETIAKAPSSLRSRCASDLRTLGRDATPGRTLAEIFASRLPDYRANLLALRFLWRNAREAYVRQNVRPLAREFAEEQLWRHLVRALYEYQYLRFSEIPCPRRYFVGSTWFERDFVATQAVDDARFDRLADAAHALCAAFAVDEARLHSVDPLGAS